MFTKGAREDGVVSSCWSGRNRNSVHATAYDSRHRQHLVSRCIDGRARRGPGRDSRRRPRGNGVWRDLGPVVRQPAFWLTSRRRLAHGHHRPARQPPHRGPACGRLPVETLRHRPAHRATRARFARPMASASACTQVTSRTPSWPWNTPVCGFERQQRRSNEWRAPLRSHPRRPRRGDRTRTWSRTRALRHVAGAAKSGVRGLHRPPPRTASSRGPPRLRRTPRPSTRGRMQEHAAKVSASIFPPRPYSSLYCMGVMASSDVSGRFP